MSSTIIVGRRAACFTASTGTFWALFETTYESNVHPRTPHESCVAFGTASQVLTRILGCLGACAGGLLRQRGGQLTPEGYLRSWLVELKAPRELDDRAIVLDVSDRLRAAIPSGDGGQAEFALRMLRAHGYNAHADAIEAGQTATLRLHADAAVLAAMYGANAERSNLAAWRVIKPDYRSLRHADRGMKFPKALADASGIAVYDTGLGGNGSDAICAYRNAAGQWTIGQMYVVIDSICSVQAVRRELAAPGEGLALVQAMLPRLKLALPPLPAAAELCFDLSRIHDDYVEEFRRHVGPACSPIDSEGGIYTLPAGRIASMPAHALRVCNRLAHCASVTVPSATGATLDAPHTTGDLFAAAA